MNTRIAESAAPVIKPEVMLIEDLCRDIENGKIRIPRFQRPFVWRPNEMLSLFDSIYRGYPIGSILLWEADELYESFESIGAITLPAVSSKRRIYVIDGHQRISTLFGVLRLPANAPLGPEQQHWQWWIYYDLIEHEFIHRRSGTLEPQHLPLRAVLKTRDFLEEAMSIRKAFSAKEADILIEEGTRIAQRINSCKLSVIRIDEGSLAQAVEIFTRLNSTGQRMTSDQMASALTYREGSGAFDLAKRIDNILDKLAIIHFDRLSREVVVQAIALSAGFQFKSKVWEFLKQKQQESLPQFVNDAEESLSKAAHYLQTFLKVPVDQLLPYSAQFSLLAEFFRKRKEPTEEQAKFLRTWFWTTSFSGWFAGKNYTQLRKAIEDFGALAVGELRDLLSIGLPARCRPFPQTFDLRSARVRTLLLVILQRFVPQSFDGRSLHVAAVLRENGERAFVPVFQSAPSTLIDSPANRIMLPDARGQDVRRRLLEMDGKVKDEVFASHIIDAEAAKALIDDDAEAFIRARQMSLVSLEREFLTDLGIEPPGEELGAADIDTDGD